MKGRQQRIPTTEFKSIPTWVDDLKAAVQSNPILKQGNEGISDLDDDIGEPISRSIPRLQYDGCALSSWGTFLQLGAGGEQPPEKSVHKSILSEEVINIDYLECNSDTSKLNLESYRNYSLNTGNVDIHEGYGHGSVTWWGIRPSPYLSNEIKSIVDSSGKDNRDIQFKGIQQHSTISSDSKRLVTTKRVVQLQDQDSLWQDHFQDTYRNLHRSSNTTERRRNERNNCSDGHTSGQDRFLNIPSKRALSRDDYVQSDSFNSAVTYKDHPCNTNFEVDTGKRSHGDSRIQNTNEGHRQVTSFRCDNSRSPSYSKMEVTRNHYRTSYDESHFHRQQVKAYPHEKQLSENQFDTKRRQNSNLHGCREQYIRQRYRSSSRDVSNRSRSRSRSNKIYHTNNSNHRNKNDYDLHRDHGRAQSRLHDKKYDTRAATSRYPSVSTPPSPMSGKSSSSKSQSSSSSSTSNTSSPASRTSQ